MTVALSVRAMTRVQVSESENKRPDGRNRTVRVPARERQLTAVTRRQQRQSSSAGGRGFNKLEQRAPSAAAHSLPGRLSVRTTKK